MSEAQGKWYKLRFRSRSGSKTQSAHSIELKCNQPPQDSGQDSANVVKKTFNTIYRSKYISSISNDMDPDRRTKILTVLNIKLPH